MDDVAVLLDKMREQDEYGVWRETGIVRREVFCKVSSINRSEFFSAGRNGLNPELRLTVFSGDYGGETVIEYAGKSYAIYRTYHVPGTDYMELYVERKGGTNGEKNRC